MIHVKARNDDDEFKNIIFRFASVLKLKFTNFTHYRNSIRSTSEHYSIFLIILLNVKLNENSNNNKCMLRSISCNSNTEINLSLTSSNIKILNKEQNFF